jgi:hypothetical protein
MKRDVPESLMIAVEPGHREAVRSWWHALSDEQRAEFVAVASMTPEEISSPVVPEDEQEVEDANEWYEYLVNQDVRFYFDRSNPQGTYNVVDPIIAPISSASDASVISHLLTRKVT